MFEKVAIYHPDKVADRIAGAIVDLAYQYEENPKIAVEVLIGHGVCHIICETSVKLSKPAISGIVKRIGGDLEVDYKEVPQDEHLAANQKESLKAGDNGIFKGVPVTKEQRKLVKIAKTIELAYPSDGKFIIDGKKLVICQSNANEASLRALLKDYKRYNIIINPLGEWTGGTDVDTGATNRKLGSDMADSATGGGLVGKDLSKADVAVNIYCWLLAQKKHKAIKASCAIGDSVIKVNGKKVPYEEIVAAAKLYIDSIGGFEKFAEYGLLSTKNWPLD